MKTNYPEVTADMVKQNMIKQFKFSAKLAHSVWQPELNETVAGEIVHDSGYLLIKDENGFVVRFNGDMCKSLFFDAGGACIAQAGDLIAITFKSDGKYLVAVEKRNTSEWWWTIAKDEFDKQRAIDDQKLYAEISDCGGVESIKQAAMLNGWKPR